MQNSCRYPLMAALATVLINGLLVLTLFPADRQFSKYPQAAAQFLAHTLPPERLLDFSPLYFYLHVVQQAVFSDGEAVVVGMQILAAAAAAALLCSILCRFFPLWMALVGTGAFVFSRSVMIHVSVLEPEAFLALFIIAFLYFSLRSTTRDRLLAGVALALALAIRPTALPVYAVIPFYYLFHEGRKNWLRPSVVVLLPGLVVLLVLGVRNGVVSGNYSPLGMNPGFVFFEGNNPLSQGGSAIYPPLVGELKTELSDQPDNPHMTYRLIASRASGRQLSTAEANRYWRQKGLDFIFDHPARYLKLLVTKGVFILHDYRRHDLSPAFFYDQRLREKRIPAFPFALLAVLALIGLVVSRHDWRRLLLFYAVIVSQVVTMLLLYVSERQRLALIPASIFFAVAGLQYLLKSTGKARLTMLFGGGALVMLLLMPNDLTREHHHLWTAYDKSDRAWLQSITLREQGQAVAAAQMAARGYAAAPWLRDYSRPAYLPFAPDSIAAQALWQFPVTEGDFSLQFDRAQLLIDAGRLTEAEAILKRLHERGVCFERGYLQSSQPQYYLASIALRRGEPEKAVALLQAGLAAAPGDPYILARLAALTGKEVYRRTLLRYFSDIDAAFLIGTAQLELGDAAASGGLAETVQRLPELWRAKIYLAAAFGAQGEIERAQRLYLDATRERKDPALLEERVVPIFADTLESGQDDVVDRYHYGLVLAQYGRFREAVRVLREAVTSDEIRPDIAQALVEVESMASRTATQ